MIAITIADIAAFLIGMLGGWFISKVFVSGGVRGFFTYLMGLLILVFCTIVLYYGRSIYLEYLTYNLEYYIMVYPVGFLGLIVGFFIGRSK